jgi:hypothetical protein
MGVSRILEDVGKVEVVPVTGGSEVGSEWADIGVAVMEGGGAGSEWAPMDAIPA